MRWSLVISLAVAVLVGGVAWYKLTANVCPVPIGYRVASIDSEFNLTEEQARAYLEQAESVWEEEVGRDLFVYDEGAPLEVKFVFDERQALADSEHSRREYLDEKKAQHEQVFETVGKLQKEYESLSRSYAEKVADYERRLNEYNQTVSQYNDRGGAPSEVFADLERDKAALSAEAAGLTSTASQLNDLATEINKLGEDGNRLVEEYNREVTRYNKQFGFTREFTQGDYQGDSINVYKFSDENELMSVLAHEFGHALGIGHVEGESSVMYYLLEDTSSTPVLSSEDKAELVTLCGEGTEWSHSIRRIIRTTLEKII